METVTVDTNILPLDDLTPLAYSAGYTLGVISTTLRELDGTDLIEAARKLTQTPEIAMFGESFWDAVLGDVEHASDFDEILHVITSGSFPPPNGRDNLTPPQRNQLRDALILEAHIRSGNRIFVTQDAKGYIKHGKRAEFEQKFGIVIFNRGEFITHCQSAASV